MYTIDDYNREIENWDFTSPSEEFLCLLTDRNLLLQRGTSAVDFHPEYKDAVKNKAVIDHNHILSIESVAYHLGYPHQKRLHALFDKVTGNSGNEGVFFSLDPKDVLFFLDSKENPFHMVYFIDTTYANDIRLQIKYGSNVISRHDLDNLYNHEKINTKELRLIHSNLNRKWITDNTIIYDVKKVNKYIDNDYDWLIVPDPIEVEY